MNTKSYNRIDKTATELANSGKKIDKRWQQKPNEQSELTLPAIAYLIHLFRILNKESFTVT